MTRARSTSRTSGRGALLTASLVIIGLVVVVGLAVWSSESAEEAPAGGAPVGGSPGTAADAALGAPVAPGLLIRPDSRRIAPPAGDRVRFVEFLDLECEACRAAFPVVERLRSEYSGRVDFVARYFPIPSHRNAEPAAFATEAAARQGRFEPMYQRMYQAQAQWGERPDDQSPVFRGFAESLGLDMARYDRDVADPALRRRVLADRADGAAAGVRGTPTIFINDRPVEGERSYGALKAALDHALAAS